jgi:THO complex subunit 2
MFGLQTYGDSTCEGSWLRLAQLVKDLAQMKIVPVSMLRLSLDLNLLNCAGLSADEQTVTKVLVRINTKILYRQQKYNILREEPEGFSKLATTLQTIPQPQQDCSDLIKNMFAIIGQFDLDPNRVLDVVLTAFEQQSANLSFLRVISSFRETHIVHILGQKFLFYTKENPSPSLEAVTTTIQPEEVSLPAPESLYAVAAALIGHGLVDLNSLLPYLSPSADIIATESTLDEKAKVKEVLDFGVISLNSAKKEETGSSSSSATAAAMTGSPAAYAHGYHSVGIAAALIAIRCYDAAYPIVVDLDAKGIDIMRFDAMRICIENILLWKISDIYELISMKKYCLAKPSAQLTMMLDHSSTFFPQQIKKIENMRSFATNAAPLIRLLGHRLCSNPILYTQLCRLMKHYLTTINYDSSNDDARILIDLVGSVFLPAITAAEGSVFLVSQLWAAISPITFAARYEIYDVWFAGKQGKAAIDIKHVDVVYTEAKALHQTKALLKRLAKENTKIIGRQLAKIAHYAPLVVFEYILNQIEHYDNLIPYVVEALKYTSDLAKDTLSYFFVIQLQRDENKMRFGQTDFSTWFATLSKFIAHFYKRYPSTELKGLLHYMLQKLGDGECFDLLVLKDLLSIMGGCDTVIEVSAAQLDGLAGGKILRSEIMGASVKEVVSKRAARVLRDELMSTNAAIPMLLFIAQIRSKILYRTEARELKLISHLYDMAQDVMMQFTDFLIVGSKSMETIVTLMPSLPELVDDIGLTLPIAFQLVRPILRAALSYGIEPSSCPEYLQSWHPFHEQMHSFVENHLPEDVWLYLSPRLYLTFWSLSLHDISFPNVAYSVENKRLKDRYSDLDSKVYNTQTMPTMSHADIDRANRSRKADLNKILLTIKDLISEQDNHRKHVDSIRKVILIYHQSYLRCEEGSNLAMISEYITQHCILERAKLSPGDAVYCTQFFFLLHELEVKYFSTLQFMDRLVKTITPLLFCTTEAEASFLGFLINDVLQHATRWQQSKKLFELEASSKIGFSTDILKEVASLDNNSMTAEVDEPKEEKTSVVNYRIAYDDYDRVVQVWQSKLRKIFQHAFETTEYMYLRSALVFLNHISSNFPTKLSIGQELIHDIEKLEKRETKRPDLQVMAKSVWAMMKRRSSSWKNDLPPGSAPAADKPATSTRRSLNSSANERSGMSRDTSRVSLNSAAGADGIEAGEEREESHEKTSAAATTTATTTAAPAPADTSNRGTKRKAPPADHNSNEVRDAPAAPAANPKRARSDEAAPPTRGRAGSRHEDHPAERMFNPNESQGYNNNNNSRRNNHNSSHDQPSSSSRDDDRAAKQPSHDTAERPSSRGRGSAPYLSSAQGKPRTCFH